MPTPQDTVENLLHQAREGDVAAREQLFVACRNYLRVIATAHGEDRLRAKGDASDVVQDTLLEAHRDFEQFAGSNEQEWLAWLRRILMHNLADFVRHFKGTDKREAGREVPLLRRGDGSVSVLIGEPPDPAGTASQQIRRQEQDHSVAEAVARLPADYQEVVVLRNLRRLPFEEVAQAMGRSRPAVQMLWVRALRRLQSELESEEHD